MPEHLTFSEHMKRDPIDDAIGATFLGQAHIAGTGPKKRTCRECIYWRKIVTKTDKKTGEVNKIIIAPDYVDGELEELRCCYPIANKPRKKVPHFAKACRLFDLNPDALPASVKR